jgi:hypothetical protein
VKTPVERVLIFLLAIGTHIEARHRGKWTIVGDIGDDREAGAAICAIDEWVTMTTIFRVE